MWPNKAKRKPFEKSPKRINKTAENFAQLPELNCFSLVPNRRVNVAKFYIKPLKIGRIMLNPVTLLSKFEKRLKLSEMTSYSSQTFRGCFQERKIIHFSWKVILVKLFSLTAFVSFCLTATWGKILNLESCKVVMALLNR